MVNYQPTEKFQYFLNLFNNTKLTHEQFLLKKNDIILQLAEMYGEVMHLRSSKEFEDTADYLYMKRLEKALEKMISLK